MNVWFGCAELVGMGKEKDILGQGDNVGFQAFPGSLLLWHKWIEWLRSIDMRINEGKYAADKKNIEAKS